MKSMLAPGMARMCIHLLSSLQTTADDDFRALKKLFAFDLLGKEVALKEFMKESCLMSKLHHVIYSFWCILSI